MSNASPELFGKYTLHERIAIGGMAEIFKASAQGLGGFEKTLAIKRLHERYCTDESFVRMLIDEAHIAVRLAHMNIAQIFDLGRYDGKVYIAMELIDGKDLFRILKQQAEHGILMPIEAAVFCAIELCSGLDYAHRQQDSDGNDLNIIHRDISPQNVIISWEGEIKIIDFGIAKASMRASHTEAGVIKGKFQYMSPEQARGDDMDQRSDIFSAGVVLYEMLTGAAMYGAEDDVQLLARVRRAEIEPPSLFRPDIPLDLERIVMKALARDRNRRYSSAHQMRMALMSFLNAYGRPYSRVQLSAYLRDLFEQKQIYSDLDLSLDYHDDHSQIFSRADFAAEFSEFNTSLLQQQAEVDENAETWRLDLSAIRSAVRASGSIPSPSQLVAEGQLQHTSADLFESSPTQASGAHWHSLQDPSQTNSSYANAPIPHDTLASHPLSSPPPIPTSAVPPPPIPRAAQPPSPNPIPPPPIPAGSPPPLSPHPSNPHQRIPPNPSGERHARHQRMSPQHRARSISSFGQEELQRTGVYRETTDVTARDQVAGTPPPKPSKPILPPFAIAAIAVLALVTLGLLAVVLLSDDDDPQNTTNPNAAAPPSNPTNTASLRVSVSGPKEAIFTLNDNVQRGSDATFNALPIGTTAKLEVSAPCHTTSVHNITIEDSQPVTLRVPLKPLTFNVHITTDPSGSNMTLDGKPLDGITPKTLNDLECDRQYSLKVEHKDHQTHQRTIHPTPSSQPTETIHIPLTPLPSSGETEPVAVATPELEDPPKTAVAQEDEPKPTAEETPAERRKRLERKKRLEERKRAKENKGDGFLSVGARPWGTVYINGRRAARETPMSRKRLKAGTYTVKVIFPSLGGRVRTKRITIQSGKHVSTFFSP